MKTEKKVAVIGYDGCRADILAEVQEENSAIGYLLENCADFVFAIYENTDSAGHNFGFSFNNPIYKNGFKTEEVYGYELIKAIEEREEQKCRENIHI